MISIVNNLPAHTKALQNLGQLKFKGNPTLVRCMAKDGSQFHFIIMHFMNVVIIK